MKKLYIVLLLAFSFLVFTPICKAQIITTIAGTGDSIFNGDGMQATVTEVSGGGNVLFDHSGNIYFCDQKNSRIRKIDPSGIVTTVAGTGVAGFSGDGGPATAAQFNQPTVITFDSAHNMYVADASNYRIRKITPSGTVSTFAGIGIFSFSGNGGPATSAALAAPSCVIADDSGNIYIDDTYNSQIRKVDTAGIITQYIGTGVGGFAGDGGPAINAEIYVPFRIAFDKHWNMYIADSYNYRIRKVNKSGIITTVAGTGTKGFSGDGGSALAAEMDAPYAACPDGAGNIYIADASNYRIRKVDSNGIINTVAGKGIRGFSGDGGPATSAVLNFCPAVSVDYSGNIYISDYDNYRIRKVTMSTSGINEITGKDEMMIYPNPGSGVFTIEFSPGLSSLNKAAAIKIYNVLGGQVCNAPLSKYKSSINLSSNPAGVYLYKVIADDGSLIGEGKLVIQK